MMEEGKKAWDLVFWNARGVGVGREFALFPAAASRHLFTSASSVQILAGVPLCCFKSNFGRLLPLLALRRRTRWQVEELPAVFYFSSGTSANSSGTNCYFPPLAADFAFAALICLLLHSTRGESYPSPLTEELLIFITSEGEVSPSASFPAMKGTKKGFAYLLPSLCSDVYKANLFAFKACCLVLL